MFKKLDFLEKLTRKKSSDKNNMKQSLKKILAGLSLVGSIGLGSNKCIGQEAILYDNFEFSGSILNTNKWQETLGSLPYTTLHQLLPLNGSWAYYVYQSPSDLTNLLAGGETQLSPTQKFNPGETLSWETTIQGVMDGGSECFTRIFVNGTTKADANVTGWYPGAGNFTQLSTNGSLESGKYLLTANFLSNSVILECTKPDNSTAQCSLNDLSPPYTVSLDTRIGNGFTGSFSFDNFYISTIPKPKMNIIVSQDNLPKISVSSLERLSYEIESSTNLNSWQYLSNFLGSTNTGITTLSIPFTFEQKKFYKVIRQNGN